jgi:DNA primase
VSGRIADASVAEVKARADLVELVREHTELRQTGVEWVGRCPFHEERTASFSVNAADKVYYCFGCGASGDVVSFVENIQAVRFGEAVEWLADRYGVELVREGATPADGARRAREERLRSLLALAAAFYERYLHDSPRAEAARAYLVERGFGEEVIRRYGLGLAPDEWDRVARAARARGFGEPELVDAGLASRARGGRGSLVDRFRGRLMFPLHDGRRQVVAFGGRRLPPAEDGPKYVNSPEGPLWHKGDILYGLHLARREIARQGHAIVVEGYTDVLALAQAGHQNVVASMGTSLTDRQLRELRRLAPRATLLFDADAAGAEAALRGLGLAEGAGLTVRVATLPPGTDPGDAAGGDTGPLDAALSASRSVLAFRVETALARHDLSIAGGRDAAFADVSAVLGPAPASVEREELVQHVAGELRLPADLVAALGPGRRSTGGRGAGPAPPRRAPLDATARDERLLLAFCLEAGDEGREVLERLGPEAFSEPRHREVREWILRRLSGAVPLPGDVTLDTEFTPELRALAAREGGPDALAEKAAVLEIRVLEGRIEALRRRLAADDLGREEQRELTELVALVRNMQETATRSRLVR